MSSDIFNKAFSTGLGAMSPVASMAFSAITDNANFVRQQTLQNNALRRQREAESNAYAQQMHMQRIADAYNTPSAQMARLREAGLNPMLAFSNGVGGNLSTGVPSAITPQKMDVPNVGVNSVDLLSAFTTLNETLNRKRELDIAENAAEFTNAKTDAERKSILKDLSFKDAIENDRHAESVDRILSSNAQRDLWFAQREKMIQDSINARNQLIENRRQFNVNMSFLKKQHKDSMKLRAYEMQFEKGQRALDRIADEKLNSATNETWKQATLMNSEYSKYHWYMNNGGSLEEALEANWVSGKSNFFQDFDQRTKNLHEQRFGQKSKHPHDKSKVEGMHKKGKKPLPNYKRSTPSNIPPLGSFRMP